MEIKYNYRLFCSLHKFAKLFLQKSTKETKYRMVSVDNFTAENKVIFQKGYVNDVTLVHDTYIKKSNLFSVENIVPKGSNLLLKESFSKKLSKSVKYGVDEKNGEKYWREFIENSKIPSGFKNSDLHYAGYISDGINNWCLPSWIWTNAALVRMYCCQGELEKATKICDVFIELQQECGGWIVRNDYCSDGSIPVLAPNDSAYIANNALLEVFKITKNNKYLESAIKCANWIIETSRPDGLVWTGFDVKNEKWIKKHTIVDIGFTAGFFSNLFLITSNITYKSFLKQFVNKYIDLFLISPKKGFTTSISESNEKIGGVFARGQAWALEGLIPAYKVFKTNKIKQVIDDLTNAVVKNQLSNGGWPYNFSKPYLGEDCKGVSVIAKNLMDWNEIVDNPILVDSSKKALKWCLNKTASNTNCKGGIFSFCMEGAIVHNLYTKTAFVYASAYAIELKNVLKKMK